MKNSCTCLWLMQNFQIRISWLRSLVKFFVLLCNAINLLAASMMSLITHIRTQWLADGLRAAQELFANHFQNAPQIQRMSSAAD